METEKTVSDEELIRAYLAGNCDAFNTLYERYKRPLYAYLNRLFRGRTMNADDVFQQTWVRAIAKLESYRHSEKFLAWLMWIAHNQAVDMFRACTRRGEEALPETAPDSESGEKESPYETLDRAELSKAIDGAVEELPPELREVFLLRQQDVAFREIARIQKCSINTCLARMQYALKKLRSSLGRWTANESR